MRISIYFHILFNFDFHLSNYLVCGMLVHCSFVCTLYLVCGMLVHCSFVFTLYLVCGLLVHCSFVLTLYLVCGMLVHCSFVLTLYLVCGMLVHCLALIKLCRPCLWPAFDCSRDSFGFSFKYLFLSLDIAMMALHSSFIKGVLFAPIYLFHGSMLTQDRTRFSKINTIYVSKTMVT